MAWVKKRAGKYQVGWRNLAGKEQWRTCPTLGAAKELKREIENTLSLGHDWQPAVTGSEPLIEEIAKAYIQHRAIRKRADTVRMDGTYLDVFQRFVDGKAKRPTVVLLSKPLLEEYMEWLARPGTSVHGAKRALTTISKFVRAAQLMWIWAEDSDRWTGIPRPRTVELPNSRPASPVAPSWSEMDACLRACKGWQRKLATWLRYTGLRVGESMQFLWTDIDMERGELTIRAEVDKFGVGRVIPLARLILDEIATWGKREGYLIPSNRRPGPREREGRARDIRRAWARAGVREAVWKGRPDHAFRKGIKSGLLGLRAHPDAIDFLQGHTLGSGSRGRYIDASHLPLRETVDLIPAIGVTDEKVVQLPTAKESATAAGKVRVVNSRRSSKYSK